MKSAEEYATLGPNGELVLPENVRSHFHLGDGAKVLFQITRRGILLVPHSPDAIRDAYGILKTEPGELSFAEEWAQYKASEIALEEKHVR
jgi:bifunctional DNA-binding transcriptional regulator/antitoxin component of YhaV-PrlF toxin-antitoxin module